MHSQYKSLMILICLLSVLSLPTMIVAQSSQPVEPTGRFVTSYLPVGEKIVAEDDFVFLYSPASLSFSTDKGYVWSYSTEPAYYADILSFAVSPNVSSDHILWAGLDYGNDALRISYDSGYTWQSSASPIIGPIRNIALSPNFVNDKTLYVVTASYDGKFLLRSSDMGQNWQVLITDPNLQISALAISPNFSADNTLFLIVNSQTILRSTDGGTTWSTKKLNVPTSSPISNLVLSPGYAQDNTIFLASAKGMFISKDNGQKWTSLLNKSILEIFIPKNYPDSHTIYTLVYEDQTKSQQKLLMRSLDNGKTWRSIKAGEDILSVALSDNSLENQTVYLRLKDEFLISENKGDTWQTASTSFPWTAPLNGSLRVSPNFTNDGIAFQLLDSHSLIRTTDTGKNWSLVDFSTQFTSGERTNLAISPNFAQDRKIFVVTNQSILFSDTLGDTWSLLSDKLPVQVNNQGYEIQLSPHYGSDQTIFIANYYQGLYRSKDNGQTWEQVTETLKPLLNPIFGPAIAISDFAVSANYPDDPTIFVVIYNSGLFRSDDAGQNWLHLTSINQQTSSPNFIMRLSPAFPTDQTLFLAANGISSGGIWRSTDRGHSWVDITRGIFATYMGNIALSPQFATDQTLIVNARTDEPYISEDAGNTWYKLRGIRENNDLRLASLDFVVTQYAGHLTSIASLGGSIMRYEWPTISKVPKLVCARVHLNDTSNFTKTISLTASADFTITWKADKNADWVSISPSSGKLPSEITAMVDPSKVTEPLSTTISMTVNLSQHQVEDRSFTIATNCQDDYLPVIHR